MSDKLNKMANRKVLTYQQRYDIIQHFLRNGEQHKYYAEKYNVSMWTIQKILSEHFKKKRNEMARDTIR